MSKLKLVRLASGDVRYMSEDEAKRQLARSKGGRTAHARGTRYKWDSKTARAAALKAWATRWRRLKWSGVRAGRPRHQRPPVDHAKLRAYYAKYPTLGIRYDLVTQHWVYRPLGTGFWVRLSERSALIRLGHLPPPRPRGHVPVEEGIEVVMRRQQ